MSFGTSGSLPEGSVLVFGTSGSLPEGSVLVFGTSGNPPEGSGLVFGTSGNPPSPFIKPRTAVFPPQCGAWGYQIELIIIYNLSSIIYS